ncbi:hypothetical protein LWM68_08730 [Niabella sp. W65]|nr:hypothetical protein [Niabella sp. W65]MCH7362847.1 hypothetical protein [Niabella sp. W65]ULT38800.1 hypothetical protein KRR40_27410 [Niabella sp. I65]
METCKCYDEGISKAITLINASQANSWLELTLDTPFHWNGTGNIVVAVDENAPNGNVQQNWAAYLPTNTPGYGRGYTTEQTF